MERVAEVEKQKQEKERVSLLEQLKIKADEEERLKRQQEETERIKQKNKPAQTEFERVSLLEQLKKKADEEERLKRRSEFEFDIVKVRLVKESGGFLGLGSKTKVEFERKKGKAQYIREDLGNGVTLDLVRIPAGKFMMGSNELFADEKPIHEAILKEFWMGKYAVNTAQWRVVMGITAIYHVMFLGETQPVIGVSWDDAKEFCKRASEKTGKSIRLPSETEWEYACRAGTTTAFHFGETITPELVNYNGNYPYGDAPEGGYRQKTIDVHSFSPNVWGLYQMHGNVLEWCEDMWHKKYQGSPTDGSAWLANSEQKLRVVRGGSWSDSASSCRSANRGCLDADGRFNNLGFRVVI